MSTKYFDPLEYNLSADFRLTKFSDLKGWGCKVPRDVLHRLLEGLSPVNDKQNNDAGLNPPHHSANMPQSTSTPMIGMLDRYLNRIFVWKNDFYRYWSRFLCSTITLRRTFSGTINWLFLSTSRWSICDGK